MLDSDVQAAGGFTSTAMTRNWPLIVEALRREGIDTPAVRAAAAATLKAEVGSRMDPVAEWYPAGENPVTYFDRKYGASTSVGKKLGNTQPGDGYAFRGRGYIQITGRYNYTHYGRRLGLDLVNTPSLALDPVVSARIFAAYFKDRGVAAAANRGDWRAVRKLVNGGYNGWDVFSGVIGKLADKVKALASNVTPATGLGLLLLGGVGLWLLTRRVTG